MSIRDLKFLSFEVANHCNMAERHPFCPAGQMTRGSMAPDTDIITFSKLCHDNGFAGEQAYHYYCDPMCDVDRVKRLISATPWARHLIWTNGMGLRYEHREWLLNCRVVVTLHDRSLEQEIRRVLSGHPNFEVCPPAYDRRLGIYQQLPLTKRPCYRATRIELPVTYEGQVRLCCGDWAGSVPIGNIRDGLTTLSNFEHAADLAVRSHWTICRRCASLSPSPIVI